jgi:protocatechuate 3,4-dioxygenase beta subunit
MPNGAVVSSQADPQGQYTLNSLPAGTYRFSASGPMEKGQAQAPQQEKTVRLDAGQNLASIDFRLPSLGVIGGRVVDENKEPVAGVPVVLVEKRYDHGALRYSLAAGRTQTNEAGVYRVTGIPTGAAFLVETANQFPPKPTEGATPANTFYPNALAADLAEAIVLNPGETRDGVDIQQKKLPAYCVQGIVEGAPESGLNLDFSDAVVGNSPQSNGRNSAGKTKPDGTFRVCGLHPGQYSFIAAGISQAAGQAEFLASGTVEVKSEDVREFKLQPALTSAVSAEVVWDGDPPAQSPNGALTLRGVIKQLMVGFYGTGIFSRSGMLQPDNYTIDVQGVSGNGRYVKDITCGGVSVLHGTAALGGAESCGALRVILAHDGSTLAARVLDADGNPIPEVWVAIVPESAVTEASMSAAMVYGQTGANGVYTARSLPPGKYRVLATNETIDLAANRVDKLWLAQQRAQEVELGPSASVQIKLAPQPLQ